jgi:hypothetical protein
MYENHETRLGRHFGGRHRGPRKDNDLSGAGRALYNQENQLRFEPHASTLEVNTITE